MFDFLYLSKLKTRLADDELRLLCDVGDAEGEEEVADKGGVKAEEEQIPVPNLEPDRNPEAPLRTAEPPRLRGPR